METPGQVSVDVSPQGMLTESAAKTAYCEASWSDGTLL